MWNVSLSAGRRIVSSSRLISRLLLTAACTVATAAQAAPLVTTTTLTLSSSSITWHTPVTLSAQVAAGGTPVSTGFVTFCDASGLYAHCEDSAIVGSGQVVAGTATFTFFPAPGIHKYTAKFDGTTAAAASTSSAQSLTVTGLYPTTTSIAATGNPSGYDLTATVVGFGESSAAAGRHGVFSRYDRRQLRTGNSVPRHSNILHREFQRSAEFPDPNRQPTSCRRHGRLQRGWKTRPGHHEFV